MENLNRVLLENVLPAHVAEHFLGRNWKNEVECCIVMHSCSSVPNVSTSTIEVKPSAVY